MSSQRHPPSDVVNGAMADPGATRWLVPDLGENQVATLRDNGIM